MKNAVSISIVSVLIILTSLIAACKSKLAPKSECADPDIGFAAGIKPIIDASCASTCHSAKKHAHSIDLSTYELVKAAAAENSFLGSIRHQGIYAPMPKNHEKLDDATIQKIACWIQNGSKP